MTNPFEGLTETTNPFNGLGETSNPFKGLGDTTNPFQGFGEEIEKPKKPLFTSKTAEEDVFGQVTTRALNTLGFGLPGFIAGKVGYEIPEPSSPAGSIGAGIGDLLGFIGGPAKVGSKVAARIVPRALKNPTFLKSAGLLMSENAISLGVANGLMTPEEGLFAPIQRGKQFGSGAVTGLAFGGLKFIPSKSLRILASSTMVGLPSTMSSEPLEMQIFNYGLGAYFGFGGMSVKDKYKQLQELSKLVKNGIHFKDAIPLFNENKKTLNNIKTYFEPIGKDPISGEQRIKNMVRRSNLSAKSFDENGNYGNKKTMPGLYEDLRIELENNVSKGLSKFRSDQTKHLRRDSIDFLLKNIKSKKDLKKYSDIELNSILDVIENPPEVNYTDVPFEAQPLNGYDVTLRPNHPVMKKAGLGNVYEKGLAQTIYLNSSNEKEVSSAFMDMLNNWKRVLPLTSNTTIDLYKYGTSKGQQKKILGKEFSKKYGPNFIGVANQMKEAYKLGLKLENRHRAKFNLEPIKELENYMPQIHEQLFNSEYIPEDAKLAMLRGRPKEVKFKFEKRRGALDFNPDAFQAFELYFKHLSRSINDDGLRRLSNVRNYLQYDLSRTGNSMIPEQTEWIKYADNLIDSMNRKPGLIDNKLTEFLKPYNKFVERINLPNMKIKSFTDVSNFLTASVYGMNMPFRMKLPIRNMCQTALNLGRVGFKATGQGIKASLGDPKVQNIVNSIELFRSRPHTFLAGEPILGKFLQAGMKPYQWSDMQWNLKNSIMAGYFSVTDGKFAKPGTALHKQAINKARETAMITQYVYLESNRSGLSRGLGVSRTLGRLSSVFTTWPTNYMEFILASSKPENRENLLKYLGTSLTFIGITAMAGIKGIEYMGLKSPLALLDLLRGKFPIMGIAEKLRIPFLDEINGLISGDKNLMDILFYTFTKE